jgi:hypothetical protein
MGRAWRVSQGLSLRAFATVVTRRRGENKSLTLQRPQARPTSILAQEAAKVQEGCRTEGAAPKPARDQAVNGRAFGDSSAAALSAWALASAASGQDVHGQEGQDDDRGRDSNDGDGGGGYNHTAILPRRAGSNRARLRTRIDHLSFVAQRRLVRVSVLEEGRDRPRRSCDNDDRPQLKRDVKRSAGRSDRIL